VALKNQKFIQLGNSGKIFLLEWLIDSDRVFRFSLFAKNLVDEDCLGLTALSRAEIRGRHHKHCLHNE
jgi:hypothetical protein